MHRIVTVSAWLVWFGSLCVAFATSGAANEPSVKIALFDVDATPPIGSPLPYSATESIVSPLHCRGVILVADEKPIVLCAVDWLGIGNDGHRIFREQIAAAAGTTPERVAVHTLHQHDAPWCDFAADLLAQSHGATGMVLYSPFARTVLERTCDAVRTARSQLRPITHVGFGQAVVEKVASNRRIMGPDGKVKAVRWTATKDPAVRAEPEGVIDPLVRSLSLYDGDKMVAVLTYYATHPQSYYGKGDVNPDFPGMARAQREEATGVPHIHFCGAGGNIGAGKYNDGSPENRPVLAQRLADGMERALAATEKVPIQASDVEWKEVEVLLPPTTHFQLDELEASLSDPSQTAKDKIYTATRVIWLRRCVAKDPIIVTSLRLGTGRILHLPGELFVEYQLAAAAMRPDSFVATAAYGDYAPCYIGTEIAYSEGGYETEPRSSLVSPEVESVLVPAIQELMDVERRPWPALGR